MKIKSKVNASNVASVSATLLFFSMGATLTWISPVLSKLEEDESFGEPITSIKLSWITTLPTMGAAFSGFFYTHIADVFGRKVAILSLGLPYFLPYLLMGCTNNLKIYYIARFVLGLAAGGTFSIVPMYVVEMSTKYNRAVLGSIPGVMICAGCLFSYSAGHWLALKTFNQTLTVFPIIFFILFMIYGKETAHFYLQSHQETRAKQTLRSLRGGINNADGEFHKIQEIIEIQSQSSKAKFFRNKAFLKNFASIVGLFVFQQLTGINALLMFDEIILNLSKINADPSVCCMILGAVHFISSLIMPSIGEKFKRKTLLILSSVLMTVFLFSLGTFCFLSDFGVSVGNVNLLPIFLLSLFMIGYYLGFGSIPFVILAEILPWRIKSLAISIICSIYWGMVTIVVKYFEAFITTFGLWTCFFTLSFFCLLSIIFVYFCVDETHGKTLEEIQDIWNNN